MLVLTRKPDECIRIGKKIKIKVLESSSSTVKLGIDAPEKIPVHREEIYKKIQRENKESLISEETTKEKLGGIFDSEKDNND